jgi:hypothetical protein
MSAANPMTLAVPKDSTALPDALQGVLSGRQ